MILAPILAMGATASRAVGFPQSLPGLQLWLDQFRDVFKDTAGTLPAFAQGGLVALQKDQSGKGNDAVQSDSGAQPSVALQVLNGQSAVTRSGSNYLAAPVNWANGPFTISMAVQLTSNSSFPAIIGSGGSVGFNQLVLGLDSSDHLAISKTGVATSSSNLSLTAGTPAVITFRSATGISGGAITVDVRKNGVAASGTLSLSGLDSPTTMLLGAGGGDPFIGFIFSTIYSNQYLSDVVVAKAEAFLTAKLQPEWAGGEAAAAGYTSWNIGNGGSPILSARGVGFEADRVEEASLWISRAKKCAAYAAWSGGSPDIGSIGLAYGPDWGTWTARSQIIAPGEAAWCAGYLSGPSHFQDVDGVHCMYAFGSPNTGFEVAPASIGIWETADPDGLGPYTIANSGNPVLTIGAAGTWDDTILYRGKMVIINGRYYLFYNANDLGWGVAIGPTRRGPFVKQPAPIFQRIAGTWERSRIGDPDFLKVDGGYLTLYFGDNDSISTGAIGLGYSKGGLIYQKYSANPITINGQVNTHGIRPSLVNDGGVLTMGFDDAHLNIYIATLAT